MSEVNLALETARDDLQEVRKIKAAAERLGVLQIQQKAALADEAIGRAVSAMENIICAVEALNYEKN